MQEMMNQVALYHVGVEEASFTQVTQGMAATLPPPPGGQESVHEVGMSMPEAMIQEIDIAAEITRFVSQIVCKGHTIEQALNYISSMSTIFESVVLEDGFQSLGSDHAGQSVGLYASIAKKTQFVPSCLALFGS